MSLSIVAQPNVVLVRGRTDRSFHIGSNSVLKLDGKTNVNSFTCKCEETFQAKPFSFEKPAATGTATHFNQTKINLGVTNLDCGNKMMNKDLQKALNADDFPHITIELIQIKEDKCNKLGELKEWVKVKALTRLTINGQSREYWLDITANKLAGDRFRFIGNKKFCMSDFGVTPPTAMMGVVKVQDEIKISLDLDVSIR